MRLRIVLGLFTVSLLIFLVGPDGYGQFQFKPKGGAAPPPGGAAPNPAGGKKGVSLDPAAGFDRFANGNPYITIDDVPFARTKDSLTQFAQDQGITNGQITRDQWTKYIEFKAKGGAARTPVVGDLGSAAGPPPGAPPEMLRLWADTEFARFDENGDGKLNQDEMPAPLRKDLTLWDKNSDGLIDQDEYRAYFLARFQERTANSSKNKQDPSLSDDELDTRPTVYRAGKLPAKGLPPWFKQLDTDNDGQVALYEWRQAGKDLDEFKFWDRDNDGFITPEEALHVNAALLKTADPLLASADPTPGNKVNPAAFNLFNKGGQGGGKGKGNFGGNPAGGQFPGFGNGGQFGGKGKGGGGGQYPGFGGGGGQMGNPQGTGQYGGGKGKGRKGGGNTDDN